MVIELNSPQHAAYATCISRSIFELKHPGAGIQNPPRLLPTPEFCILNSGYPEACRSGDPAQAGLAG
jgi:hypothetical protein